MFVTPQELILFFTIAFLVAGIVITGAIWLGAQATNLRRAGRVQQPRRRRDRRRDSRITRRVP